MNNALQSGHQRQLKDMNTSASCDILLRQKQGDKDLVALFEFGRGHEDFWKKIDQARNDEEADIGRGFNAHPVLLVHSSFGGDDPASGALRDHNEHSDFAITAFLCWQNDDPVAHRGKRQCTSLLWRAKETRGGAVEFLDAMASLAAAALCLQKWHNYTLKGLGRYTVLGPNCCKVYTNVSFSLAS